MLVCSKNLLPENMDSCSARFLSVSEIWTSSILSRHFYMYVDIFPHAQLVQVLVREVKHRTSVHAA